VKTALLAAIAMLAAQACAAATPLPPTASPTRQPESVANTAAPALFAPTAAAKPMGGGCGSTTVLTGGIPDTLIKSTGDNAPSGVPYAVARPATAAGFIFGYPLHVPSGEKGIGSSNKILWVVGLQRTGDLVIDGVPLGKSAPAVHYSFPPNSSPGEIYPSGVDVPEPGCWVFTLRFAGQTAQIELEYR
jgi:hypothetical protein